jgi:hypothetical protein
LQASKDFLHEMVGPGTFEKWLKWRYPTDSQQLRGAVKSEIDAVINNSGNNDVSVAVLLKEGCFILLSVIFRNIQLVSLLKKLL